MTVNLSEMVRRLEPFAARHGVLFREIPAHEEFPEGTEEVSVAPFDLHLGIERPCTLLYQEKAEPTGLIHEMGHVLFGFEDEYRWFGWEWVIARLLDVEEQWLFENRFYAVSSPDSDLEFSELETWDRSELPRLFDDRLQAVLEAGIELPTLEVLRGNHELPIGSK